MKTIFRCAHLGTIACMLLLSITASSNTCIVRDKRVPVRAVCGRIYNELGELPEGAKLTLQNDNGSILYTASIDQHGKFSFGSVTKGDYTLRATARDHYLPQERKIRVTQNKAESCRATIEVKLGIVACAGGISVQGIDKRSGN